MNVRGGPGGLFGKDNVWLSAPDIISCMPRVTWCGVLKWLLLPGTLFYGPFFSGTPCADSYQLPLRLPPVHVCREYTCCFPWTMNFVKPYFVVGKTNLAPMVILAISGILCRKMASQDEDWLGSGVCLWELCFSRFSVRKVNIAGVDFFLSLKLLNINEPK